MSAYVLFSEVYDELTLAEAREEIELILDGKRGLRGQQGCVCPTGPPGDRAEFPENFE